MVYVKKESMKTEQKPDVCTCIQTIQAMVKNQKDTCSICYDIPVINKTHLVCVSSPGILENLVIKAFPRSWERTNIVLHELPLKT